ncbi:hypothetical protein [Yoonia sp.]|uniref:hypothetical protein n=1 Tax=Yoonia sp. TaxID=2212373 RepID=UPI002E0ABD83|nr:hypothetical protein [Yoonia sp.]
MAKDTMGVDVSKDRLDAFWHSQEEACSVANTAEGFEQLCAWIGQKDDVLIVLKQLEPIIVDLSDTSVWLAILILR